MFITRRIYKQLLPATLFLFTFHSGHAFDVQMDSDSIFLQKAGLFFESGRYDSAIIFYEKYLSSFNPEKNMEYFQPDTLSGINARLLFEILLRLGTSYNMISDPDNALKVLYKGLNIGIPEFTGYPEMTAWYFYQSGNAWLLKMDYTNAIRYYQSALASAGNDIILIQKINQNLGGIFFFLEDYDKAIEHYQKALLSYRLTLSEDPVKAAELLINTGAAFAEKNDFHNAMEYYSGARELFISVKMPDRDYARLSINLGNLLLKMNNPGAAYDQFIKASELYHRSLPVKPEEMVLLYTNIARYFKTRMLVDSTIRYLDLAVSCIHETSDMNSIVITDLYKQIGENYGLKKDWKKSLEYYEKALNVIENEHSELLTGADPRMRNAAEILDLSRIRQEKAIALHMLGLKEGSEECIIKSFHESLSVIDLIKKVNEDFGRESSKLLFNETVKNLYYNALETGYYLLRDHLPGMADQLFSISEKSRNKILLSGIIDNIAKRSSGIPDSIITKERKLNDEIFFCFRKLWMDPEAGEEGMHDRYLFYLNRLIENHREVDSIESWYNRSSPVYRKLKGQEMVTDYAHLKQKLSKNEALIEYFIGDTSMFIFIARSDSLIIKRTTVPSDFNDDILEFNKEIRLADIEGFYESGYHLYSQLILPVRSSLMNISKLIIIPDENLAAIPFEALVTDTGTHLNHTQDHSSFLVNDYEISYHFSSTLWFNSSEEKKPGPETISYAGFAPVNFISGETGSPLEDKKIRFSSLPFSGDEIHDVSALIRKTGGTAKVFTGHDATPERFRDNLEGHSIIHVATHSLINGDQPGLSGLVLYPGAREEKNESAREGMVYLDEILNLRINADLVVLSACATGTGKITRSEGVLAMTRGFYTAGATNIVYSLWNVNDKHTKDFMVAFFKGILSGKSYSAAMRNAKLEMICKPETSLPRLWAPCVLLGNN